MPAIRAKAICLFRHGDKVLLADGYDPGKDEHYLIPVGGGIEFGELAADAALREVREEIGAEACNPRLLAVFENHFVFNGVAGHEIVFAFEADFLQPSDYQGRDLQGVETNGLAFKVRWVATTELHDTPVYPPGLKALL